MKWIFALCLVVLTSTAFAVQPGEQLSDSAREARARRLSAELRCLVCQNQSIDDSDAELARDLRRLVRERIMLGEDDAAIRAFLVARYGEFVLLRPSLNVQTALLWSLPLFALAAGIWLSRGTFRKDAEVKSEGDAYTPLTEAEEAQLREVLSDENTSLSLQQGRG